MKSAITAFTMNLVLAVSVYFGVIQKNDGAMNIVIVLTWIFVVVSLLGFVGVSIAKEDTLEEITKIRSLIFSKFVSLTSRMMDVCLILLFAYFGEYTLSFATFASFLFNGGSIVVANDAKKRFKED